MADNSNDTGVKLTFPDPRIEAAARANEFREMTHEQRMHAFNDVLKTGRALRELSPNKDMIDEAFLKREAKWQAIEKELFPNAK